MVCRSSGDPHITMFAGHKAHPMGSGPYVLARSVRSLALQRPLGCASWRHVRLALPVKVLHVARCATPESEHQTDTQSDTLTDDCASLEGVIVELLRCAIALRPGLARRGATMAWANIMNYESSNCAALHYTCQ